MHGDLRCRAADMKRIRKILAIADPSQGGDVEAQRAVRRAFGLAEQMNAELQLLSVCDYSEYVSSCRSLDAAGLENGRREYSARKRAWLQQIASTLVTPSVPLSTEVVWDRPRHEAITRQVLRYEPDLVIKDTHHHSVIKRALFTNTDWHLIRECPAPLLLVRSDAWPSREKILAAVDPLHEDDKPAALDFKIIDTASNLAHAIGGELHALHVFEPMQALVTLDESYVPSDWPMDEINRKLRSEHADALRLLVAGLNLPSERVHLREGAARYLLCDVARELDATLVVMGAIARSGLRRLFVGCTAEQVLEFLPCDVLIVKPDGFVCPVECSEQGSPS